MKMSKPDSQETGFSKQTRHLQAQMKCELACEGHAKHIKIQESKCLSTKEEAQDCKEYLENDIVKKSERLAEVRRLFEHEKMACKHKQEEMDLTNKTDLQKHQEQLDDLTSHLPKLELRRAEVRKALQHDLQSCNNQLVLNQKVFDATVAELSGERPDPVMVDSIIKEKEELEEKNVTEEFLDAANDRRAQHVQHQQKLDFLLDNLPKVRQKKDTLQRQKRDDESFLLDAEQVCDISINPVLKKEDKKKAEMRTLLEADVKDLTSDVENLEINMGKTRNLLRHVFGSKLSGLYTTHQEQSLDMSHLKLLLEKETSRYTKLKMAKKEADIIYRDTIKKPRMDVQKLRRQHSILESYAPVK